MAKHSLRLRASYFFPLIAISQIPSSSAHPFRLSDARPEDSRPGAVELRHETAHARSISDIDTEPWLSARKAMPDGQRQPDHTVDQIADGQVQEPYEVYTQEVSSTRGTQTFVGFTTVTSWLSFTQEHKEWTSTPGRPHPSSSAGPPSSPSLTTSTSVPALSSADAVSTASSVDLSSTSTPTSSPTTPASSSNVQSTPAKPSSFSPSISTFTVVSTSVHTRIITSVPDNSLTSLTTSAVQTVTASLASTNTNGVVQTSLETSGNPSVNPFPTSITTATSTLSLIQSTALTNVGPTATKNVTSLSADNIFLPLATNAPPSQIPQRSDHPVPKLGIEPQSEALETNKFYANFFLGSQTSSTWTHPYSVAWSKGSGESGSWGLAISHIERSQLASSPASNFSAGEWDFFANPLGIQSLVLSAAELSSGTSLTTDSLEAFSVNVNLVAAGASEAVLTFPLVQGMGFVTGVYNSGTPLVQSGVGIMNLTYTGATIAGTTYKYRAMLQDGFTWLIYVSPSNAGYAANTFTLLSSGVIQGPSGFGGHIQIAKIPGGSTDAESVYDASAGAYATAGNITGSVQGTVGDYTLSWSKSGVASQPLLMFALPHHVESLSYSSTVSNTSVQLETTTKGMATAIRGDSWPLSEPNLPISMSFAPWTPSSGSITSLPPAAVSAIVAAGTSELSQDIAAQTNVGSLYYDGKALAKFAAIIYTVHDLASNATLAMTGLRLLQDAFALHVNNSMTYPLVYDSVWGGAVSSASYPPSGSAGADFGNTYYNDHHFHYGYFVYAAAVIAYLDPAWLAAGSNAAWVNMLVRDYANPSSTDPYFPFSRSFDWYHGHSWAHGLFDAPDGKDQESSSEDAMASYGLKMWGHVTGDAGMEARGNLMLAIQARAFRHYYLYTTDNAVEPPQFIGNKAAGILFENKVDHTTYFGARPEYIEGIHMLPLMPYSTLTRSQAFVQQEWDVYFGPQGRVPVETVTGGWRGILMADYAIVDAAASYDFFSNATGEFDAGYLDGGASQTWYLAWSAALATVGY